MVNAVASSSRRGRGNESTRLSPDVENGEADEETLVKPNLIYEEGWTEDTFVSRPIKRTSDNMNKIQSLQTELNSVIMRVDECFERAKEVANAVEECSENDPLVLSIEKNFLRQLEQRQLLQIQHDVLDEMAMTLRRNEEIVDAEEHFRARCEELSEAYMKKTPRMKFKDSKQYKAFRDELWEINHPTTAGPPLTSYLPREDDDDSDEEIEIGGSVMNFKCPITLKPLTDAVTSSICGHSFNKPDILLMFAQAKNKKRGEPEIMKCPFAGCTSQFSKADLKDNPALQRRANERERRERLYGQTQEDPPSDAEVVLSSDDDD